MVRTHKAPADPKDNQSQDEVADTPMKFHRITANLDSNKAKNNSDQQKPMKQANGQVPHTNDFLHT